MTKDTLQKIMASAGIASRRGAESLIKAGEVRLNGQKAKLGDRAGAEDAITVRGKRLELTDKKVYIKLNKPVGYVCTARSFPGEQNVFDLVKVPPSLAIVGRLDKDSEGLLLLTDDGELVNRLTHPKYGVDKVYVVTLAHDIASTLKETKDRIQKIIAAFTSGIDLAGEDGMVKAERMKHLKGRTFEVVLRQGRKRQIRRMFRRLGCHVARLTRVRIGPVTIGRLKKGQWKFLAKEEIEALKTIRDKV